MKKKIHSLLVALMMCFSIISSSELLDSEQDYFFTSLAASVDYPAQFMNIASKDNSKVLTENGTSDGSSLSMKTLGGNHAATWRFDRVGANSVGTFFKITNGQSGRLITPNNYNVSVDADVIMFGSESHQCQHWFVIPVKLIPGWAIMTSSIDKFCRAKVRYRFAFP